MDETDSVFRAWCDTHSVTYETANSDELPILSSERQSPVSASASTVVV